MRARRTLDDLDEGINADDVAKEVACVLLDGIVEQSAQLGARTNHATVCIKGEVC